MYRQLIADIYKHLSPGYRRVADFLLEHYREAAFMTAAEVGRAADVDTTLVVRFAQRLGYPGYPELIAEIQEEVKRDLKAVYYPTPEEGTPAAMVFKALTQDRNNLEFMINHNDPQTVETVIKLLADASRIILVGEGNSHYLAEAFAKRMLAFGKNAHAMLNEPIGHASLLAKMKPGEVVIGLGMTQLTPGVAVTLKMARDFGAHTVGIVGSHENPVAAVAEYVLMAPVTTAGMLPSMTGFCALLNALVQALIVHLGDPMGDWALHTDKIMQEYVKALGKQMPSVIDAIEDFNRARARREAAQQTEAAG